MDVNDAAWTKSSHYTPLSRRPIAELRAEAEQYRRMAATASTADIENSLLKLAMRFDALADHRERNGGDGGSQSD
jgi:hypothetical protein